MGPALTLFLVAPLVSEFLPGTLPLTMLPALLVLAPLYGGGAVVVREVARRRGGGWPAILLLGTAFGVVEEAFTTQTLFNPDYLHLGLHLLEGAWVAPLGMGAWWTLYVLGLHAVWSIGVSTALVEGLFPARATSPWLGRRGLAAFSLILALGALGNTAITARVERSRGGAFLASPAQFAGAAAAVLLLVALSLRLRPRTAAPRTGPPWPPAWCAAMAFGAGLAFLAVQRGWGWAGVAAEIAVLAGGALFLGLQSRRTGFGPRHRLALAGGATAAYAARAFALPTVTPAAPAVKLAGNVLFGLLALAALAVAARRVASAERSGPDRTPAGSRA